MSKKYMDFVPVRNADNGTAVTAGAPRRTNVAQGTVVSVRTTATRSTSGRTTAARVITARTTTAKTTARTAAMTAGPRVMMPEPTAVQRTRLVRKDVPRQATVQRKAPSVSTYTTKTVASGQGGMTIRSEAKLGEIEDLSPRFVKVDVPKRPLGEGVGHAATPPAIKDEVKEVKSRKLIGRFRSRGSAKAAAKSAAKTSAKAPAGASTEAEKKAASKKETFVTPKPTFINQDKVAKRPLSKNVYQKKVVATDKKNVKGPVAIIEKPQKESKVGLVITIILTIILGAVAGTVAFLLLPR